MAAKIMLVEDDTNLSEIYKARLDAEGYQISSAKDGEEALALAVKEHPDLIISDIMMPNISGFDMLDILRSTPGIEATKVIMMTALGQAEDKTRAEKLGADRYLVKSQVTLEDVVKVVREVLESDKPGGFATPKADISAAAPEQPALLPQLLCQLLQHRSLSQTAQHRPPLPTLIWLQHLRQSVHHLSHQHPTLPTINHY
jgi:DNA-binding response OmpR family regulator